MRTIIAWLLLVALLPACVLAAALILFLAPAKTTTPNQTHPGVKVIVGDGHGSGVHIGGGLVITAAHVVDGFKMVRVKTEAGDYTSAEVLWSAVPYDVALLQLYNARGLRTAELTCKDPDVGTRLQATGNPGALEFIRTWGLVSSGVDSHHYEHWRRTFIADITTRGGFSGGPVYDMEGRVRGIVVGVAVQATSPMAISIVSLSYVVPGSVLCMLLGRA
jgi:S1-C subfamily serine protease